MRRWGFANFTWTRRIKRLFRTDFGLPDRRRARWRAPASRKLVAQSRLSIRWGKQIAVLVEDTSSNRLNRWRCNRLREFDAAIDCVGEVLTQIGWVVLFRPHVHFGRANAKTPAFLGGGFWLREPDDYLLSHGNPHYHRRRVVSRSCSGWEGVGPTRYGHQAKGVVALLRSATNLGRSSNLGCVYHTRESNQSLGWLHVHRTALIHKADLL